MHATFQHVVNAEYRNTMLHHAGSRRWIEHQQNLVNLRSQMVEQHLPADPHEVSQQYFDLVQAAEQTEQKLVDGCVALARRHGLRNAIHEIRAAAISDIDEHILLDRVTSAAY